MEKATDAPIRSTIKARLEQDLPKLRKAIYTIFTEAALYAEELNRRLTPIYQRQYYQSYRGWPGGSLRRSFYTTPPQGKTTIEMELGWTAYYASYLEEKGEAGTAHARTPGTTLLFRKEIEEAIKAFLAYRIANLLEANGWPVKNIQVM